MYVLLIVAEYMLNVYIVMVPFGGLGGAQEIASEVLVVMIDVILGGPGTE